MTAADVGGTVVDANPIINNPFREPDRYWHFGQGFHLAQTTRGSTFRMQSAVDLCCPDVSECGKHGRDSVQVGSVARSRTQHWSGVGCSTADTV